MFIRPNKDFSPLLGDKCHSRHLELVGVLRWVNELGSIDIFTEVSILSQNKFSPR